MKSKHMQRLLRLLLLCAGAGAGAGLAFLCVQVYRITTAATMPLGTLALLYGGMGVLGMLAGHLVAPAVIRGVSDGMGAVVKYMDNLTTAQLAAMSAGLMAGLLVAALTSQMLHFLGDSIFTLAASAALYVVLGATGVAVGKRRTEDFAALLSSNETRRERRARRQPGSPVIRVADLSALVDGRLAAVVKTGFLAGDLVIPTFVLEELRRLADSQDEVKRARGQRGLETAEALKADKGVNLRVEDASQGDPQDADVRLLQLTKELNAALLTNDYTLNRAARVSGLTVLNLNDLACALRPVTAAGDVLSVRVTKEGREAGQGVGYLEDGTMLVVEGGREHVGSTVSVTVTSVLQTSAGRMVFARLNGEG